MKPKLKSTKAQIDKPSVHPLQISYIFILTSYSLITVITPSLNTWDSNGSKFLSLALLNLLSYVYILTRKEFNSDQKLQFSFFNNNIGLAYTLFLLLTLVSFTKAINMPEAILSFVKYFTVFCSAYIISIILRFDKRYFRMIIILMVLLLVVDSFTVFYNIYIYILKLIPSISDIKSVYSNKNILASAIFVKIPFALWLLTFENSWLKKLGYFALFSAFLATFFMSTRAFYLGIIFLTVFYSAFALKLNFRSKEKGRFQILIYFLGILTVAFIIFTYTQSNLYPENADTYNVSVAQRFETISVNESSSEARLDSWKRSLILFKHDPFLGVGTGNWKIRVLEYENPTRSDFAIIYKNHNDFIEIATETGIFGVMVFISLILFLTLNFLKAFFKPGAIETSYKYFFLSAFGILCYSIDAFFNFPADRPEIQSVFALYIGVSIGFSPVFINAKKISNQWLKKPLAYLLIITLLISSYILFLNFNTLRLQLIADGDFRSESLAHSSKVLNAGFSSFLNVSANGTEPITIYKSRYLINQGKYQDAINILRPDVNNPYLGRRELFMAIAFSKLDENDSALLYAYKAHRIKPLQPTAVGIICKILMIKNRPVEATIMMEDFLENEKYNTQAWLDLTSLYRETGNYPKALETINRAIKQLPEDSAVMNTKIKLQNESRIVPNQQIYSAAMDCLSKNNYPEALKYLNEFIGKETGVAIVYAGRAYCFYYSKEFTKCIKDVDRSIILGDNTPDLINLRGLCYHVLGNMAAACNDFKNAASKGDKDAMKNVLSFCKH